MLITIDGPAGSGKSTVARQLADRLGFEFLNTGAMYRAIALKCLRDGIDLTDGDRVAAVAVAAVITFPGRQPHLDGEDVGAHLQSEAVSAAASHVAINPGVREALVALQRAVAAGKDMVTEGRDQGTIVFPAAELKIFLTASPETRAARRHAQLPAGDVALEEVLDQIRARDERDATRPVAPLVPAADAVPFDTSDLTIDAAVAAIEALVRQRQS